MSRESMEFDVVIIGGGVAGLGAAIKLAQLSQDISICVVEKAAEIGGHILSGAVLETRALDELIPNWKDRGAPLKTEAKEDSFYLLSSEKKSRKLPTPPQMKNHGNYIASLGNLCRWLGEQAESLGVQIFPGFPASDILYNDDGSVAGILTGEFGRAEDGSQKDGFQDSMELRGKFTLFAEGCRGSLTKQLEEKFNLRPEGKHQTYGIGIKELWQIDPAKHKPGKIVHTIGWPMDSKTYGGSFMYHLENNQVAIGFVVGLDYQNPYLSPFQEFQRYKQHPLIKQVLAGGKRIAYGARALNEGGFQSIPTLDFAGGAIIGCAAGFMNVPKIKGSHTAMKSGMLAAESVFEALQKGNNSLESYATKVKNSWIYKELKKVRNIRPAFNKGMWFGLAYSALDTYILRGYAPWTFKHHKDHENLAEANSYRPIDYPKPDGEISFDILSSVYLSNTNHAEDQPVHLQLQNPEIAISTNLAHYDSPESRYCPAGVYEIISQNGENQLQINSQNCLHCKTCDIKDPTQNINWVTPEGGGGPNYTSM